MAELEANTTPQSDPLAKLHRMSTTAGVGSQEYVAINTVAIWTLILGLASVAVVLFESWPLLVVPLAAVVLAVIGLRQIARSNGTQAGRLVAIGGIVLAVGFSGLYGAREYQATTADAADRAAVDTVIRDLGEALAADDYAKAYEQFDYIYRARVSPEQFKAYWSTFHNGALGRLKSMQSTNKANFSQIEQGKVAETMAIIAFEKGTWEERRRFMLLQRDGVFRIVMTELHPSATVGEKDKPQAQ